jgi:quinol monooxygenase YgiN
MVGGQGVSISQYSQHKEEAWKFLEWLMTNQQQWKWVEGGGVTAVAAILKDPKFLAATPANQSFPRSMSLTKDYWHLAAYPQLLEVLQKYVHQAITGQLPAKQALDLCAGEHERILEASGSREGAAKDNPRIQVTVVARIKAKPGMEEKVREELSKLLAPTRREKGCINYDMHQSIEDRSLFLFYENWTSEEDLQNHLGSPHIRAWFDLSQQLLAEPVEITRWQKAD